jgi:hypothetical protein
MVFGVLLVEIYLGRSLSKLLSCFRLLNGADVVVGSWPLINVSLTDPVLSVGLFVDEFTSGRSTSGLVPVIEDQSFIIAC